MSQIRSHCPVIVSYEPSYSLTENTWNVIREMTTFTLRNVRFLFQCLMSQSSQQVVEQNSTFQLASVRIGLVTLSCVASVASPFFYAVRCEQEKYFPCQSSVLCSLYEINLVSDGNELDNPPPAALCQTASYSREARHSALSRSD